MAATAATGPGFRWAQAGVNQRAMTWSTRAPMPSARTVAARCVPHRGRGQVGGGAAQREPGDPLGRVRGQPHAGHAAQRHPGVGDLIQAVPVEQAEHVGPEVGDGVGAGRGRGLRAGRTVPAVLEPQQPEVPAEHGRLRAEQALMGTDGGAEGQHRSAVGPSSVAASGSDIEEDGLAVTLEPDVEPQYGAGPAGVAGIGGFSLGDERRPPPGIIY